MIREFICWERSGLFLLLASLCGADEQGWVNTHHLKGNFVCLMYLCIQKEGGTLLGRARVRCDCSDCLSLQKKKQNKHQPEGDKKWNCPMLFRTNDFFVSTAELKTSETVLWPIKMLLVSQFCFWKTEFISFTVILPAHSLFLYIVLTEPRQ